MVWFIFALLTALSESIKNVLDKRAVKKVDRYVIAWGASFFAFLFLVPVLLFKGIPEIGNRFWLGLFGSLILNLVAVILYLTALKSSDLSMCIPMITFTPLFLLLMSPLMLGEFPTVFGLIGILLIVIGSYTLNITKRTQGWLAPFKALLKEKGPRLMLVVAFLWSITTNFDKMATVNSSPLFYVVSFNLLLFTAFTPIVIFRKKKIMWKAIIPIGFALALVLFFQMTALSLAIVPYVISIKRTSVIMSVIFGALFFKEKGIKERLLGATIMILGVLFITLF